MEETKLETTHSSSSSSIHHPSRQVFPKAETPTTNKNHLNFSFLKPHPRSQSSKTKTNPIKIKIKIKIQSFQQMQPTSGGGLARFRSAPATWLEALLESDDEQSDIVLELPKPPPNAASDLEFLESAGSGGLSNFLRQNSSPAEFHSVLNNSDGYFSSLGIPSSYDYGSQAAKRAHEAEDLDKVSPKMSSSANPLKREKGGHLQGGVGSLDVEMDKMMEESVMCKARAKRGCATHPRSIAERVRRTRISDRIRKLQELVPNMDKQTNTADMLDEAVAYVKLLQKQIQELSEKQQNCTCSRKD